MPADTRKVPAEGEPTRRQQVAEHADTFLPSDAAARLADTAGAEAARSTDTVLVVCKLPHGFIMEIVQPGTMVAPDGKPIQGLMPSTEPGQRVFIKGANSMRTNPRAHQGVHPYAITRVPRSLWEAWIERNRGMTFVRNALVFMAENPPDAQAMAKERIKERTGLEGLNPKVEKDPRLPKATNPNAEVQTDPASLATAQRVQEQMDAA